MEDEAAAAPPAAAATALASWSSSLYPSRIVSALRTRQTTDAQPEDDRPLLEAPRAAQHVLSAIKHGRPDLLTRGVFDCLPEGAATRLDSTLTHWNYAGFSFIAAKSALGVGVVAAVAGAPALPKTVCSRPTPSCLKALPRRCRR